MAVAVVVVLILSLPSNFYFTYIVPSSVDEYQTETEIDFEFNNNKIESPISNIHIAFTENRGQLENDEVRFYDPGGKVWFTDGGVWFELREEIETRDQGSQLRGQGGISGLEFDLMEGLEPSELVEYKRIVLKQEFIGANEVRPIGKNGLSWNSNFFYGNDSGKWCTNVPNYAEVYYENIYDGIDLRYYSNEKGLKYDFIVHPYADPNQIRIRYEGAESIEIDGLGNLKVNTEIDDFIDGGLAINQEYNNSQYQIESQFVIMGKTTYGFELLQDYNRAEVLIIDPLLYSTYLGGQDLDEGMAIAVDLVGYSYITGYTVSFDFPTTPGVYATGLDGINYDVFVSKFEPTGLALNYSTYVGGGHADWGNDIDIDSDGNAVITGTTMSYYFPTTDGAFDITFNDGDEDCFIFKINNRGSELLFSTFIGSDDWDFGYDLVLDKYCDIYMTGTTHHSGGPSDFPTTPNAFHTGHIGGTFIFLVKLSNDGSSLLYSTFLFGGYLGDLTIDKDLNTYVTGFTQVPSILTTEGAYDTTFNGPIGATDCFLLKLNLSSNGFDDLKYATYIGGSNIDVADALILDSKENVIITGKTNSTDFPVTENVYDDTYSGGYPYFDSFVCKLNITSSKMMLSTYMGGNGDDSGTDISLDTNENIIVSGITNSSNFPITMDAFDKICNKTDGFIAQLSSDGSKLLYSSYVGGTEDDRAYGICTDSIGILYLTGETNSTDFPTTPGAIDKSQNGNFDSFLFKMSISPIFNFTSISLLKNEVSTDIIHTRLQPYTFRICLVNGINILDLQSVKLTLDPLDTNIQLLWTRSNDRFDELTDSEDHVTLHNSSIASNYFYWWTIDFNIIFNWSYPNEDLFFIQLYGTSNSVAPVYRNFTKDYHVENDLIFNGTLEVASEKENRLLNNNDLVMGGEELYWSGLRPVYQNSFGVYPPENEFDITIWDGIGNHWSTSPAAGEFFQLKTNAQDNTNLEGDLHIINITGIPPTSDTSNTSFSIRIDGDNVSFSNATPNNRTWHMDESIYVGITIEDYGGGLVDGNSIMYAISTDNGESYDDWLPIPTLKDETILATQTLATFANGRNNYIKWLALDSLGNGPTDSQPYRILIDTEEVIFSNPWPAAKYLSFSSMVEVGINISDNLSGVNGSKIEYSISENDGQTWNNWISVDPIENSNNLSVRLNITLSPGSKNRIRWRAYDVAGNGPTKSEEYIINIWSFMEKKPEIELISPPKGSIFGNTSVELIWNVTNLDIPGITYIVVLDSFDPPYNVLQDMITTLNFKVENLWDKTTYYWKIVPVIDGIEYREISSDVWWFSVDLSKPPLEKLYNVLINGKDFVSLYPGENVNITLQITNLGETRDSIKVRIQSSNISTFARWEKTYPLALSPNESGNRTLLLNLPDDIHLGFYEIFVEAYSLYSEDR
jgi:hypothetical protein